jgi:hypothetical protein
MAKKWPGMVVQRTFIKEHSFVYRLYYKIISYSSKIFGQKSTYSKETITLCEYNERQFVNNWACFVKKGGSKIEIRNFFVEISISFTFLST